MAYQEYRDEEVSFILIDEELSEKGKLLKIKNHYKTRLLGSGRSSQSIKFVEKEIREEIHYERKRIQTAFNNLSYTRNEATENMAMGNIGVMQEALGYALAEIATEIAKSGDVAIPLRDQHEFNEAKKLGREVDDVQAIHADQLKKAQEFHDEAKSWGLLLWGGFILLIAGVYVYMYSPFIIQALHGIGESGTQEAKRTQNVATGIVYVFGAIFLLGGLGVLYQAGLQSLAYPFALMGWIVQWGSLKLSLKKTHSYNGEAKQQTRRALLWAISPSFLFLGLAFYYIVRPFSGRIQSTTPKTVVANSFQPNALINLNRNNEPVRDAGNANANIIETLASNTAIFILYPEQKKRWYEVQTQSGKTGWIDGFGFRLASSSEIASYSPGANNNSTVTNSDMASNALPVNANQNSNSSEVATTTPLPNPLINDPRPIENPERVYKLFAVDTRDKIMFHLYDLTQVANGTPDYTNYFTDDVIKNGLSPMDAALSSIIFNGDSEILSELNTTREVYLQSLTEEIHSRTIHYDNLVRYKYTAIELRSSDRDVPERREFLDEGKVILNKRLAQFVQMIKTVSVAPNRDAKLNSLLQFQNQIDKETKDREKAEEELNLQRKERRF